MISFKDAEAIAEMASGRSRNRGKAVLFGHSGGRTRYLWFRREAGFVSVTLLGTMIARIYEDQIILNHQGNDTATTGKAYRALGINWSHSSHVAYVGGTRYHENHPVTYSGRESADEHWLVRQARGK